MEAKFEHFLCWVFVELLIKHVFVFKVVWWTKWLLIKSGSFKFILWGVCVFRLLTVHHAYCKQNTLKHVAFNYSDTNATHSKYSNTNTSQCQTYLLFRIHLLSQSESKTWVKTFAQDLTPQHRVRNRCRNPRFGRSQIRPESAEPGTATVAGQDSPCY